MPLTSIILLAFMPLLTVLSAACSASETALFSLTHADRLRLRKTYPAVHAAVARLLAQPRALLISLLLANTMVNTSYFVVASVVGKGLTDGAWGVAFGAGSLLFLILFGEVLPKSLASVHRVPMSRVLVPALDAWHALIRPVRTGAERLLIAPIVRVLSPQTPGETMTTQDLASLVRISGRGVLDDAEKRLLSDVVELSSLRVRDVMTPRVRVPWLDANETTKELLDQVRRSGMVKFPLCKGELEGGSVLGLVTAQAALPVLHRQGPGARAPLTALLEPLKYVPDRARLDQLLDLFRSTRTDAALCVSEDGAITGMVEVEDLIRELTIVSVGHASSLTDQVRMVGLGVWEVPGRLTLHTFAEAFSAVTPANASEVSTVAGLIQAALGRMPQVGDCVDLEHHTLRVERMSGRGVERVIVSQRRVETVVAKNTSAGAVDAEKGNKS